MNNQLIFDFTTKSSFLEQDFIVSQANEEAFSRIKAWPNWPLGVYANILYIYGPKSCGKSHLCAIWQKKSNAKIISPAWEIEELNSENNYIIEDIEQFLTDESKLFHSFNIIKEMNKSLLITSVSSPSELKINLPDLKSRISSLNSIAIGASNDEMLQVFLTKLFSEKQLKISQNMINYIITHSERSLSYLDDIVCKLNLASLSAKKHLNLKMIKEVLSKK